MRSSTDVYTVSCFLIWRSTGMAQYQKYILYSNVRVSQREINAPIWATLKVKFKAI